MFSVLAIISELEKIDRDNCLSEEDLFRRVSPEYTHSHYNLFLATLKDLDKLPEVESKFRDGELVYRGMKGVYDGQ